MRCPLLLICTLIPTCLIAETPEEKAGRVGLVQLEKQPRGDLGNGYFRNPILVGPMGDVTVVRVGADYYMTTGSTLIWHSGDLVNWRPLTRALARHIGTVWAPDLAYHNGLFYLYLPVIVSMRPDGGRNFSNFVLSAKDPAGPWSDPIDLKIGGIDPGHIADTEGNRYVYVNTGRVAPLSRDGLKVTGPVRTVYEGWKFPEEWMVECMCLESPKLLYRTPYYYLVSAEGGTAGPSTAHMVVVARSATPTGPWENSPYNPMIRTRSPEERWWRQGHGQLVDDVNGNWWILYTGYERDYPTFGKIALLLPVEWTPGGWPIVSPKYHVDDVLPMPPGSNVGHGMPISDDFRNAKLGLQWRVDLRSPPAVVPRPGGGMLRVPAKGASPSEAATLTVSPANHTYEVEVEVEFPETAEAGLILTSGGEFSGAAVKKGKAFTYWRNKPHTSADFSGNRIFLKFRNRSYDVAFYYSAGGKDWKKFDRGIEVRSHARSVGLYAAGSGEVVFRNFKYRGFD